jgi:hypothetical protein
MPTYLNGVADANGYYSGITVADETALLEQIRDALVSAGHSVVTDQILAQKKVKLSGIENGQLYRIEFATATVSGSQKTLSIQGDKTGTGTILSTAITIPFYSNGQAKLFLTADSSAGCLFIHNPAFTSESLHFGFLENREPTEQFAWMIGKVDQWFTGKFIAESLAGENWKGFNFFYYSSGTESQTSPDGPYQGMWDYYTTGITANAKTTSNNTAFGYKPWLGAVNSHTGKPILGSFFVPEGYTTSTTFPINANAATPVRFRGVVKFARTGLASLNPAVQCKESSKVFISGGSAGVFQGFQIAE